MEGLGLVGYGSEDEEGASMSEGEVSDPNATGAVRILGATSPAASNLSGEEAAQSDHPHVLAGPAANPEPPPEGLSPPLHHSETEDGGGPAAELRSAAHILPAELREPPPGEPNPELVAKVGKFLDIKIRTGHTVMDAMRRMREWNNPDFLEKMVEHFSLDPYGSCFPKEVWDPTALPPEDTWAQLSEALKRADQRRAAERAARAAVAFGSGGVQMPATAAAGLGAAAAAAAAGGVHQLQQAPKGPGLPRAPITAAAAGGMDAAKAAQLAQAAAQARVIAAGMQQRAGSKWDAPKR